MANGSYMSNWYPLLLGKALQLKRPVLEPQELVLLI